MINDSLISRGNEHFLISATGQPDIKKEEIKQEKYKWKRKKENEKISSTYLSSVVEQNIMN